MIPCILEYAVTALLLALSWPIIVCMYSCTVWFIASFFSIHRQWASKQNPSSSSSTDSSKSGCKIEVWANRPHRLCRRQKQKEAGVVVPMGEADVASEFQVVMQLAIPEPHPLVLLLS